MYKYLCNEPWGSSVQCWIRKGFFIDRLIVVPKWRKDRIGEYRAIKIRAYGVRAACRAASPHIPIGILMQTGTRWLGQKQSDPMSPSLNPNCLTTKDRWFLSSTPGRSTLPSLCGRLKVSIYNFPLRGRDLVPLIIFYFRAVRGAEVVTASYHKNGDWGESSAIVYMHHS